MKKRNCFLYEYLFQPPNKIWITNKPDVYHFDVTWSMNLGVLNNYGPKSKKKDIDII